jgi:Ca2+/H+ antiporter, TMEM165/GDT1 family
MARATHKFGEAFGIGSRYPGRVGGTGPKSISRLTRWHLCGSVPRLDLCCGPRRIGDKTQILSLLLAARFQQPVRIICGILLATLANHAAAGLAGTLLGSFLTGPWMRWLLGLSFLGAAVWALFPDKYEGEDRAISRSGAFTTTLVMFFCAEIGDKTQIATVSLAARFEVFYFVVLGTTLGMMLANIPIVFIGDKLAGRLPLKPIRVASAVVFATLGIITLSGVRL